MYVQFLYICTMKKDERINIRLPESLKVQIKKISKKRGLTISQLILNLLKNER